MTTPPTDPPSSAIEVAVRLAEIHGTMQTGFATINGKIDVAFTRTHQAEADIKDLREETALINGELSSIKQKVWFASGGVAAVVTIANIVVGVAIGH